MPKQTSTPEAESALVPTPEPPTASVLLKNAQRLAGFTVEELAEATGISRNTVFNALRGFRYIAGGGAVAYAPKTVVVAKLAAALGIPPERLTEVGREDAAKLLSGGGFEITTAVSNGGAEAVGYAKGRRAVIAELLALVSTDELHSEVRRRAALESQTGEPV